MSYRVFKMTLTQAQQRKLLRGLSVKVDKSQLGVGSTILLHPTNFAKVSKAKSGVVIKLSPGEILATASHSDNNMMPEGIELSGSGFFSDAWEGIKKVGSFLKSSGIASTLADAAATAAVPFVGGQVADIGRKIVKDVTGVGAAPMAKSPKKPPSKIRRSLKASGLYI
jgi:hypothetical protein